jgi:3-oxoacyl-[acyl-carrier-protein] synthase III
LPCLIQRSESLSCGGAVLVIAAKHPWISGDLRYESGRDCHRHAARTPVGSFNGALSSLPAYALGEAAIRAALQRAGVDPADVDEVILGQVLIAGQGQNPARQAAIAAGIPVEATAFGVNQVCGSGLRELSRAG